MKLFDVVNRLVQNSFDAPETWKDVLEKEPINESMLSMQMFFDLLDRDICTRIISAAEWLEDANTQKLATTVYLKLYADKKNPSERENILISHIENMIRILEQNGKIAPRQNNYAHVPSNYAENFQAAVTQMVRIKGGDIFKNAKQLKGLLADITGNKFAVEINDFCEFVEHIDSATKNDTKTQMYVHLIEYAFLANGLEVPDEVCRLKIATEEANKSDVEKTREKTLDELLLDAVKRKDVDVVQVKELIEAGADVNARFNLGWMEGTVLIIAARLSSAEVVKLLIEAGADVNARCNLGWMEGWTALMIAAMHRSAEVVKLLIDAGVDLNVRDEYRYTALTIAEGYKKENADLLKKAKAPSTLTKLLFEAIDQNDIGKTKIIIKKGVLVNARNLEGYTPLMCAIEKKEVEIVKLLIGAGAELNVKHMFFRWTALMFATRDNSKEIAKILLEHGADVNARNSKKETALIIAAKTNSAEVAKLLIDAGAEVDAKDNDGRTALMFAAQEDSVEVAKLLIDAGADVNARDNGGRTALVDVADAFVDSVEVAKLLIEAGADVNARDNGGRTALMSVTYEEVAKLFIDAGAEVDAKDNDGRTALMSTRHEEVAKLLIDAGAEVDARDNGGGTALMHVATYSEEVAKLLIDAGAEVDARDNHGLTALMWAVYFGATVSLLLEKGADVNAIDDKGNTVLTHAMKNIFGEEEEIIALLKQHGATE